jgi:gamma-glutamyltranspeptidase / glutathione hydrolase
MEQGRALGGRITLGKPFERVEQDVVRKSGNVRGLIDPDYLKARAGTPLGASRPACAQTEQAPGPSTSEVSIVDAFDGALAMTTTINVNFGAWITTGGFILNDAMTNFSRPTDGGCPANAPAGSKRAQTAMAPVIATDASGAVVLVGGSAGAGEIVDYVRSPGRAGTPDGS